MAVHPARLGFVALGVFSLVSCLERTEPCEVWATPSPIDVASVSVDLLGIDRNIVIGAAGTVVVEGELQSLPAGLAGELLDVVQLPYFSGGSNLLAVGTEGTVLSGESNDAGGIDWTLVDLGTSADLRAIGFFELPDNISDVHVVVVGDGVLFERTPSYADNYEIVFEWTTPTPPPEGWGSLRGAGRADAAVVGDGGRYFTRAWQYTPADWTLEDIDTSEDLVAYCGPGRMLTGSGTLMVYGDKYIWNEYDVAEEGLVACDESLVLSASGRIFDVEVVPVDALEITELGSVAGLTDVYRRRRVVSDDFCAEAVGLGGIAIEICPCDA